MVVTSQATIRHLISEHQTLDDVAFVQVVDPKVVDYQLGMHHDGMIGMVVTRFVEWNV